MKNINLIAKIITKVLEITYYVATALMAGVAFCAAFVPKGLKYFMDVEGLLADGQASSYGFSVEVLNKAGKIDYTALCLFAVGSVLIFIVMAWIFRNLNLIIKKSENGTPFQTENIKRLKKIGILSIVIPLIGLIMSTIIRIALGADFAEISVDQSGVIMGIIILCITQYFAHGVELEKDVDGLL